MIQPRPPPVGVRTEKSFQHLSGAPGPDRNVGARGWYPGGSRAYVQAEVRELARQRLRERGVRLRRVGEADGAGLEHGLGEGGVGGDGAQDRV